MFRARSRMPLLKYLVLIALASIGCKNAQISSSSIVSSLAYLVWHLKILRAGRWELYWRWLNFCGTDYTIEGWNEIKAWWLKCFLGVRTFKTLAGQILETSIIHEKHEIHKNNQWIINSVHSPIRYRCLGRSLFWNISAGRFVSGHCWNLQAGHIDFAMWKVCAVVIFPAYSTSWQPKWYW